MKAPTTALSGFMVLLVDDTGPLGSWLAPASHRVFSPLKMIDLSKAMLLRFDLSTVLSVKWSPTPRLYSATGDDVLVIHVPGTHEVATPKPRAKTNHQAPVEDFNEAWDPTRWRRLDRSTAAPAFARAEAPPEVVAKHCGIKHTLGSFRDLQLVTAFDRLEGFTAIHEERRACMCGAVLTVTTKRLLGDKL